MRRYKYIAVMCAIAAASVLGCDLLGHTRFFRLLHLKAGDIQFLLRGPRLPANIVLLVIDQKTLDRLQEPLMFWHPYYAQAIRESAAAGARVLGLDITFAIPVDRWAPGYDALLMSSVQEVSGRMPVVCGYAPSTLAWQRDFVVPVNMIAAALGQSAYVNLKVDPDDFVRNLEIIEAPAPTGGAPPARSLVWRAEIPGSPGTFAIAPSLRPTEPPVVAPDPPPPVRSLALRVVEKYLGQDVNIESGVLSLAGGPIALAGDRTMAIDYPGPAGSFPRISLVDFLDLAKAGRREELRRLVAGKIVMLGGDTIEDRHATPFYTLAPGKRANTAGVEVHAAAVDTLLGRHYLVSVPASVRWLALFLSALAAALAGGYLRASRAALAIALLAALTIAITQVLFRSGQVLSASEILLAASLALVPAPFYRSLRAEKRGTIFRNAVALFVDRKVARTLDENETLPAAGSRQMVTILFSDIRGFTAFCDEKDPVVVVELLNQYLTTMVSIIVRHGGQANKFIGDGIMAIFSDEDGAAAGDHASRAVHCGIQMAREPGQFRTGVGIHTGLALVGCIGSADKMDFTALGDTVNLASRLESLNKKYHTQLLMSETTHAMLPAGIETTSLGQVQVRGRNVPMSLFTASALYAASQGATASAEHQ